MSENQYEAQNLIIPIYLDTNALLDLLASIEDGFTSVEKVTTLSQVTDTVNDTARSLSAELTTPFLKLNLNPAKTRSETGHEQQQREEERYHTSGSLFNRLRTFLIQEQLLKRVHDEETWKNLQPSDFVELSGIFRPHPFVEWFHTIDRLFPLIIAASDMQLVPLEDELSKLKVQAKSQKPNPSVASLIQEITGKVDTMKSSTKLMGSYRELLNIFRTDVDKEDIRTFVVDIESVTPSRPAVTSIFVEYLRDKSAIELSHKRFSILGKVVQRFEVGNESINLLSGSGLGGLNDSFLNNIASVLNNMSNADEPAFNLPTIVTKIPPPALQIVPIAIYI